MAKLTLSEAARACGVARTTIQRAVRAGRISLDAEHQVDTAELLRAGYQLDAAVPHAAAQQSPHHTPQNAALLHSTPPYSDAAWHELQFLRQERDLLQQERNRLAQHVDLLLTLHQTTQQQLTQAQQMLHEMQYRYDRLLEAPRPSPPAPVPSVPVAPPRPQEPPDRPAVRVASGDSRGAMRRRILALLRDHPEGLTTGELRQQLQAERSLADTCVGMAREGLLQRVGRGTYVVA